MTATVPRKSTWEAFYLENTAWTCAVHSFLQEKLSEATYLWLVETWGSFSIKVE